MYRPIITENNNSSMHYTGDTFIASKIATVGINAAVKPQPIVVLYIAYTMGTFAITSCRICEYNKINV